MDARRAARKGMQVSDHVGSVIAAGPILVVAPHPDDETLGCGGLIAAASRRGLPIHVVFVTDGSASHPNSRTWSRPALAALREVEANEALRRLGAEGQGRTFLRLKDADMPARGSPDYLRAKAALITILRDLSPSLLILPWRRDPHCDHRDAWRLVMDAVEIAGPSPDILEYAIWLDELGKPGDRPRAGEMEEVRVDISSHLDAKRHALAAHCSQLGGVIEDDHSGFVLDDRTLARLTGPEEAFWRPCGAG